MEQSHHNEENPVVQIIDNARFNRTSLLGELADDAYQLDRPGKNYVTAARLVWNAMRRQAIQKKAMPMTGDGGRDGYILIGMGPSQALQLMWPAMEKSELLNAINAIRLHLRKSDNAVCIRQGRKDSLPEWWVSAEFAEIKLRHAHLARANPLKQRPRRKQKQVPASALEPVTAPPAPEVTVPETHPATDTAAWNDTSPEVSDDDTESRDRETRQTRPSPSPVDELEAAFAVIRRVVGDATALTDENKLLRERLDRITDVLQGG